MGAQPSTSAVAGSGAKSIILFSDGTGNSSGKLFKTNVFRVYEAVDLGPTQPDQQRQIAYYDDGVGTSAFKPLRMLQGVFGIGLKRNVLEIYSYACRNYDPKAQPLAKSDVSDPGDHIYGFGFSRGAFTMRLVIGLIADQGLIPYTNEKDLDWKVEAAWKRFRRRWPRSIDRALKWLGLVAKGEGETALSTADAKQARAARPSYDPGDNYHPVIRFIGVWDTVAAYGGPVAEITRAIDNFIYRLSMPNYELHPRVRCARHALALDDERDSFQPLLWDELAEKDIRAKYTKKAMPWLREDRLQQVWFVGMHADVGGGYPDESLSYVSLLWMLEEAHKCGLRTVNYITNRYHGLANSYGPVHNSRAGFGGYYRFQPRRIAGWMDPVEPYTLGLRDPAIRGPAGPKGLIEQPLVHASVIARIASGTDGYAPIVLPAKYRIVPEGARGETLFLETTGGFGLSAAAAARARKNPPPVLPPRVRDWLTPAVKAEIAGTMERAWDLVWWRRGTYFLTMLATLLLFAMPWWVPPEIPRKAGDPVGFLDLPVVNALWEAVGNLVRMLGGLLPNMLDRWIDAWANHPVWFLFFLGSILLVMAVSAVIERRIADTARRIWHSAVPRIPPATASDDPGGVDDDRKPRVRNSYLYQRTIQLFKWLFLPNLLFGPLMVGLIVWFLHALAVQLTLPLLEARLFCQPDGRSADITQAEAEFSTAATCNPVKGRVVAGERYTIGFEVTEQWQDADHDATPAGIAAGDLRWGVGYLGAPFRRAIGSAYLQPVAAVRADTHGNGFQFIQLRPLAMVPVADDPNRYQAEFEAPATGELYLFANDAVVPYDLDRLYENNKGEAHVTIVSAKYAEQAAQAPPVKKEPAPDTPAF